MNFSGSVLSRVRTSNVQHCPESVPPTSSTTQIRTSNVQYSSESEPPTLSRYRQSQYLQRPVLPKSEPVQPTVRTSTVPYCPVSVLSAHPVAGRLSALLGGGPLALAAVCARAAPLLQRLSQPRHVRVPVPEEEVLCARAPGAVLEHHHAPVAAGAAQGGAAPRRLRARVPAQRSRRRREQRTDAALRAAGARCRRAGRGGRRQVLQQGVRLRQQRVQLVHGRRGGGGGGGGGRWRRRLPLAMVGSFWVLVVPVGSDDFW